MLKHGLQLGASFLKPLRAGSNASSVEHQKRVRQTGLRGKGGNLREGAGRRLRSATGQAKHQNAEEGKWQQPHILRPDRVVIASIAKLE
jgi:hypothetical protein